MMLLPRSLVRALIALGSIALVTTTISGLLNTGSSQSWWSGLLLNLGTGFLGTLITFVFLDLIIQSIEKRQEQKTKRTQLTIALHDQFQSMEMIRVRQVARKILLENFRYGDKLDSWKLYQKLYFDEKREEDWLALSRVFHFYEEIGELLEQDALNEELTRIFFYNYLKEMYDDEYFGEFIEISKHNNNWAKYVHYLAQRFKIETTIKRTLSDDKSD